MYDGIVFLQSILWGLSNTFIILSQESLQSEHYFAKHVGKFPV